MRHVNALSKRHMAPAPARSLLVWQAEIQIINGILDLVERVLGLVKGSAD